MAESVAVEGDVQASAGSDTTFSGAADTGSWSPGSVSYTGYINLKVGGVQVVHQAQCTFTFSGSKTVGTASTAVSGSSTVTLTAGSTTLQGGRSNVLKNGDSAQDSYGNRLETSASGKLKLA